MTSNLKSIQKAVEALSSEASVYSRAITLPQPDEVISTPHGRSSEEIEADRGYHSRAINLQVGKGGLLPLIRYAQASMWVF